MIIIDLKLLATGAGIGALSCSAFVGVPDSSHVCGTVALVTLMVALSFRAIEARLPHKHPQQQS